ncbi:pimeloyl-CoA dehydrogenase large subunit [Caulobacter sp. Root487D2Y]|uniref:acyl-CoA dehydrogenase family protein n=1 Tax=Caulobacter sp. Root487D2Y TaxID=1736547 RepID=UPI0006F535E0|nr:acyl-CoA dehydrogenase family protein [Caulobacter sp. Root487D2Y]KQY27366.1 pimeloyl-CoA dehydrogenase large subunit [Caulobacter sp. Root487D2Y]
MDLAFSAEDLAFQQEVRDWIATAFDDDLRRKAAQSKNGYLDKAGQVKWQKKLFERGWAAPDWPVELGGAGFTPSQRYIFNMELALAGTPNPSPMGLKMCAPVVMAFGTPEQKAQHLPPILSSDIWWCQGYSEPGSGSDLASLQMKAERDGDDYVLNGSKIWTTHAQWADWMFCLVRTSTEGKPQEGISFLLLPMTLPGIQIKPLPTLDGPAEGEQEINQVFFDNVRVPVANRIGEENKGWTYAKYLLEFERGNAYAPGLMHMLRKVKKIASAERADDGGALIEDPDFRRKIAELEIAVESLNATELRIFSGRGAGKAVGPASSMLKLAGSETQQAITELALEAVGSYAAPFVRDTWAPTNDGRAGPDYAGPAAPAYFSYRKTTIYAGSSEIQKNIITKLVLGL